MNRKILVWGGGYLGLRLQDFLGCEITTKKIFSFKDAEKEFKRFNPEVIINCVGHIGRNVDECEKNIDVSLIANSFVPIILLELAIRNKVKLVHISSGCIYHFDYTKDNPIEEEEIPDFFELFYSRTKIYSEKALEPFCKKFNILILRPRIPLDNRPHPKNILTKLIKYRKIINLPNSVTYIPDFLEALKFLIEIDARGIFNVVNKGALKYPQLLEIYKRYFPNFKYKIVDFKELGLIRTNLILSTKKLEKVGFKIRNIEDVLEECVRDYVRYLRNEN
ncbi:MAG: sugar nucleotide-binding protein [Candidatus Omnitrophica bacterium]|nr:sugar nucleotide-binding protein [Candidatus Omnitrophota bacterium]